VNRTLDYVARLDERNRAYRVTAAPDLTNVARWWTGGVILDQGHEGSCVGHGVVGEWLASPARGVPPRAIYQFSKAAPIVAETRAQVGHHIAVEVYNRARQIDEFEGDFTDGTSVRAGMLVHRERGWSTGFRWAFNMAELRAALEEGPVVIGVEWRDSMYEAPGGRVTVSGDVVGGHCLLVTGYSPNYNGAGPVYRWRNSWGGGSTGYGANGNGYIKPADLDRVLFQSGGEAAVAIGRKA
jgi:hypothetical protein